MPKNIHTSNPDLLLLAVCDDDNEQKKEVVRTNKLPTLIKHYSVEKPDKFYYTYIPETENGTGKEEITI